MFNPTSTANNQSPMARSGLLEGPLSNIGTPPTYGKQRNGSRTADEYMIEDALKAQAEFAAHRLLELSEDDGDPFAGLIKRFSTKDEVSPLVENDVLKQIAPPTIDRASQVWIEEQEEAEEQKLIEKNLKFWDEFKLNGSGVKIDEVFDVLKEQLRINNDCLRICIKNLKKLHPEKGKRTLKKLNPDKNSDQQQQQQQQQMWLVLFSIGSCADDSSYVQTAMMDCEKQQERGKLPEGEKTYKTYQQDLGARSGGFVLELAIAEGLLDLFRMLGSEEGLKGKIGAEDELKANEEEEKATPVMTHLPGPPLGYKFLQITSIGSIIMRDMDMDDGGRGWSTDIAVKVEVGSVRELKHDCKGPPVHLEEGAAEDRASLCDLFDGLWKPGGQG
ncbi:hypothetical protein BY996DRAFT_6528941 [Phakopsora pachyrhizi]|nr:hypothetical protein BY996DRAFT_6528941 [Phakopsora pachyrhizi]